MSERDCPRRVIGRGDAPPAGVVDAAVAAVAEEQAGAVSRAQAMAAGLTDEMIGARLAARRWQRLYPGGYATFSGPVPRATRLWAAVLRAGPGAVLSHETAAELVGLIDAPHPGPTGDGGRAAGDGRSDRPVHVTVPPRRRIRPRAGVVAHYSDRIARARHAGPGLPRTGVEETVVDLVHAAATLERAIAWVTRALGRRLTTPARLRAAVIARGRLR